MTQKIFPGAKSDSISGQPIWCEKQGDLIGRIFTIWVIVSSGQVFLKITEVAHIFLATYFSTVT
jgi:hypothetical protein